MTQLPIKARPDFTDIDVSLGEDQRWFAVFADWVIQGCYYMVEHLRPGCAVTHVTLRTEPRTRQLTLTVYDGCDTRVYRVHGIVQMIHVDTARYPEVSWLMTVTLRIAAWPQVTVWVKETRTGDDCTIDVGTGKVAGIRRTAFDTITKTLMF